MTRFALFRVVFLFSFCCASGALAQIENPNAPTDPIDDGTHDWVLRTNEAKTKRLFWATRTIVMEVNYGDNYKPLLVSEAEYRAAIEKAMSAWNTIDVCETDIEFIAKDTVGTETNLDLSDPNSPPDLINRIIYRTDEWPASVTENNNYSENSEHLTLALTTTRFGATTGQIMDADIDINAATKEWGTGNVEGQPVFDVQGVLTHELGHVLGFDHSSDPLSTMRPSTGEGVIDTRDLTEDDKSGVCFWYPKGSITPGTGSVVQSGLQSQVTCSIAHSAAKPWAALWLAILSLGLIRLRRRG